MRLLNLGLAMTLVSNLLKTSHTRSRVSPRHFAFTASPCTHIFFGQPILDGFETSSARCLSDSCSHAKGFHLSRTLTTCRITSLTSHMLRPRTSAGFPLWNL